MRSRFLCLLFGLTVMNTHSYAQFNEINKQTFNRLAQELNVPIFWRNDANQNNQIDPNEIVYLWGLNPDKNLTNYVVNGKFTQEFIDTYKKMLARLTTAHQTNDDPEAKRRALVVQELAQARPTLLESDFTHASAEDRAIVKHMIKTAYLIDELFLKQNGVYGWDAAIPADDTASKTLFFRNHGPFCLNPQTENNPDCNALASKPKRVVDVYPKSMQEDQKFCSVIQNASNASDLITPFDVVIGDTNRFTTVSYTQHYKSDMHLIAKELRATAKVIQDPAEQPFKNYLLAAAKAFENNDWYAADEAWAKMNAVNSKWYLRIGPDEQYWEPCNLKAGFHMSFATINPISLYWQTKLDPLKNEMEQMLATLAGAPYKARDVNFHLPDFIDIVLNAGDSRSHTGGTIGQSLPNTGPVANEGRGRTVVMANMSFPDEDAKKISLETSASLFCPYTMELMVADPKIDNLSTVLHEAAHNLGPAHEYKVNGKTDQDIFGGPMSSMLEELKAQTSALYFTDWLVKKGLIDQKTADQVYVNDLRWAFGHISKGMYTQEGSFKTYSQLAAIQFGELISSDAVRWHADKMAANGKDKGCFEVNLPKYRQTVAGLEKQVLQIKARGDVTAAEKMRSVYVDTDKTLQGLRDIIRERLLRTPTSTFVYSIKH